MMPGRPGSVGASSACCAPLAYQPSRYTSTLKDRAGVVTYNATDSPSAALALFANPAMVPRRCVRTQPPPVLVASGLVGAPGWTWGTSARTGDLGRTVGVGTLAGVGAATVLVRIGASAWRATSTTSTSAPQSASGAATRTSRLMSRTLPGGAPAR